MLIWLLSALVGVGAASILVLLIYEGSREMEVVEAWLVTVVRRGVPFRYPFRYGRQ